MKQGAPGVDWQPNEDLTVTTDHVARFEYSTNSATDNIYLVEVTSSGGLERSSYQDETLFINISYDENGNATKEYKNLQGQVVAKKSHDGTDWLTTYYAYDDFGLLRHVLTPEFIDQFVANYGTASSVSKDDAILKEWCYYYEYDAKKRMTLKRLPGTESVLMVYDKRDRLVFTQDGVQRSTSKWSFIRYDVLNRPVMTGQISLLGWTVVQIQQVFETMALSEERRTTEVGYTYNNSAGGLDFEITESDLFTVTYYDDYSYPGVLPFDKTSCIANANEDNTYSTSTIGMVTGSLSKLGTTTSWVKSVTYYDDYGRNIWSKREVPVETGKTNIETSSTLYNHIGLALKTKQTQTFNGQSNSVIDLMTYDHTGRLIQKDQKIEDKTDWTILTKLNYNELGQLTQKKLGNSLQTVDYNYNIRGWLTKINDTEDIGDDLYCQNLAYNNPIEGVSNEKQYNGNISAITWIDGSYPYFKSYKYTYDALNRLIQADYNDSPNSADNAFGVHGIKYDLNGNIKELKRNGYDKSVGSYGAFGVIDDLVYSYSGNQLIGAYNKVHSESSIFKSSEYKYDANGNMNSDKNKGLAIFYNHLNLPKLIFIPGGTVNYLYDAAGTKYKKTTRDGFGTRYYFSNFEYDKDMNLEFIHTSEGRIRVKSNYTYDYYLKDHLGNTRVVFTNDGNNTATKLQVSNYYPFGARFGKTNSYSIADKTTDYMFNGKEFQEELEWYDYGKRMYDPALGRWMNIDPMAELLEMSSPFVYSLNNPIIYIDEDGELPILVNGLVASDGERGNESYWDAKIISTIKSSGIANPGGEMHYVDGDAGFTYNGKTGHVINDSKRALYAGDRKIAGGIQAKNDFSTILSKLARDPDSGKIIEKIQIYSHSRGGAFSEGYTGALLELINQYADQFDDPSNVIDFILHMAPHQSNSISAVDGIDNFGISHTADLLSGNDIDGATNFTTKEGNLKTAHGNGSFTKDLNAFVSSFASSGGDSQKTTDDFVKKMKEQYSITVTVKQ